MPKTRTKLFYAQNGKCFYCREPMLMDHKKGDMKKRTVSLDHVVPQMMGGKKPNNSVAAHRQCNADKGTRMPTEDELKRLVDLWDFMARFSIDELREMYRFFSCGYD
ncbi:MAG: HNH endonuclease [Geminicoccaceae bacterium]